MFHGQISPRKRPLEQASPSQQVESKKTKFEEPIRTRRGPWTADEDELLTNLVKKFGTKKWALIAELVPGRVGKQCRERYLNHLRTDVKKTAWTEEEDMTLVRAQQELGNRWSAIARLLPGRPENSVKNRWNSLCNKRKRWSGSGDYEDSDGSTSADEQSAEDNSEGSSPGLKQQRTSGMVALSNEGANSVSIPYDVISDRGPSPQVAYCTDPNAFIWSLYSHRQQQMSQMYMSQQQQQHAKPLSSNNLLPEVRTPLAQTLSLPKALVVEQRCFSQVKANTPTQAVANRSPSATHESGTPLEEKRDSASGLMLLATLCT